jgi:hypothetical protein
MYEKEIKIMPTTRKGTPFDIDGYAYNDEQTSLAIWSYVNAKRQNKQKYLKFLADHTHVTI